MASVDIYCCDIDRLRRMLTREELSNTRAWMRAERFDEHLIKRAAGLAQGEWLHSSAEDCYALLGELAEKLGRPLPNSAVSPFRSKAIAPVDRVLEKLGLALRLLDLLDRRGLVALPRSKSDASLGYWETLEVRDAFALLDTGNIPAIDDEVTEGTVWAITDWLEVAASRNEGLIGIYHP